jgi:uncharacterized membrane protein YeaQ/YmgE (transglycosylase-associated protein family)
VTGGFVGSMIWNGGVEFQPGSFFLSLLGAILLVFIVHKIVRGTAIS